MCPYGLSEGKKFLPDATETKKDKFYMDSNCKRPFKSNGSIRLGPKCSKKSLFHPIEDKFLKKARVSNSESWLIKSFNREVVGRL